MRSALPVFLPALGLGCVLALAPARPAPAHHTNVIQYVFQRVGTAQAGPHEVVLTASRPKAPAGTALTLEEEHKLVGKATHRFQAEVLSASPVPPLRVRLRFAGEEWSREFALERQPGADPVFAANVALGPKGKYAVEAVLEEAATAGRSYRASFSFDFSYEGLKEVMRALRRSMDRLGRETLTLGLDGEIVPPAKHAEIRKLAARFREMAPLAVDFRQGARQELYAAEGGKLAAAAQKVEAAAAKGDFTALTARLAEARAACESCHRIFQEADASGKAPQSPPKGP